MNIDTKIHVRYEAQTHYVPFYRILNNNEWYQNMSIDDYKENIAKHFKMVDMLDRAV